MTHKPPQTAFVWHEPTGLGRAVFSFFRRRFFLSKKPAAALMHLFADELMRLFVNGQIVHCGPARFLPSHPEFDTIDIAPFLTEGENTILVEAHSRGARCFQAIQTPGAFIAWGRLEDGADGFVDLSTPGEWMAARGEGRDSDAEPFSFAQGPIEILDTRTLLPGEDSPSLHWGPAVPITDQDFRGELTPRSIPLPVMKMVNPFRIDLAAPLADTGTRYGFRVHGADVHAGGGGPPKPYAAWVTHLFSPLEQEIEAGVFWSDLSLNGVRQNAVACEDSGNRQNVRLKLSQGWNFLYGCTEVLAPRWPVMIEIPAGSGVTCHSDPDRSASSAFRFLIVSHEEAEARMKPLLPRSPDALAGYPDAWAPCGGVGLYASPARDMAWDRIQTAMLRNESAIFPLEMPLGPQHSGTVVLTFEKEFLGHPHLEIEAPAGTVLDFAYDEIPVEDGTLRFYRANPFVNNAERFILRGGRQAIDSFHERGGRMIQITVRNAQGPVRLHGASIRSKQADMDRGGGFECGDPLFNWTWAVGVDTLQSSLSDGWIDPWRERGLYMGDTLVESAATRCFSRNWRFDPWALRLWARSQRPDGMLPGVVPITDGGSCYDFTLIWILYLHDYWRAGGDNSLVNELWPCLLGILNSSAWISADSGLWMILPTGMGMFLDWGVTPEERAGVNPALNALRIRVLDCAAELAAALGLGEQAGQWKQSAAALRTVFSKTFWLENEGRFAASLVDGKLTGGPSAHANAMALAWNIGTPLQKEQAGRYFATFMEGNHRTPPGRLELYFLHYALQALRASGRVDLAEEVIRNHYGLMRDAGAWAFWECYDRSTHGLGSHCHGWATAPLIYFHRTILGVDFNFASEPGMVRVSPQSASLDWAKGSVPHPLGLIRVEWRKTGNSLTVDVEAPEGLTVLVEPRGRLASLTAVVKITH